MGTVCAGVGRPGLFRTPAGASMHPLRRPHPPPFDLHAIQSHRRRLQVDCRFQSSASGFCPPGVDRFAPALRWRSCSRRLHLRPDLFAADRYGTDQLNKMWGKNTAFAPIRSTIVGVTGRQILDWSARPFWPRLHVPVRVDMAHPVLVQLNCVHPIAASLRPVQNRPYW